MMTRQSIQLFNQALLAKQAWRILINPGSLLARVLLGKYCQKASLLEAQVPTVSSHGWRSILHGRDLLKENIGKAIGNGQTTKLWKDAWISLTENSRPIGPIPEHALDLSVSDILTTDMTWNKSRIEELLPQFAKQIQELQPSRTGAEDTFIWQPLQSGIYTTKSGYYTKAMKGERTEEHSPWDFNWIKDVWSGSFSPKMKTFLWSIIQKALPFGENLQSRGIKSEVFCIRCKEKETACHTFFHCQFAKEVWSKVPLLQVVHTATISDFREAVFLLLE